MNEYESLRQQAKAKRDIAIAKARQEYRQSLKQIAAIQRAIMGDLPRATRAANGKSETPTLRVAIIQALGDRKLTAMEITVRVLEMGYRTAMSKGELHKYVKQILRRGGRFRMDGAKWIAIN